jgi:hypothetical protein
MFMVFQNDFMGPGGWEVGSILPKYGMGHGIPYTWLPNFGPVEQHTDFFPIKMNIWHWV